ncbi:MAG: type II secretion system protein GspK [Phycisphaerae bacterium]|nr:type II secretion system protein GspK [Phycisphaerae bacterium]
MAATQLIAFRTASVGREALARVQARWAARAGIEESLAVIEYHTENPDPEDQLTIYKDLEAVADGSLLSGSWSIRRTEDGVELPGPQDEGAKANVNHLQRGQLLEIPNMAFDVADSILDWRDEDSEVQSLGAERDFYINRNMPYQPRNANFRSLAELELVAGAWPEYVRGEDANLNGRLDPNEDDGAFSAPDDNGDGLLQAGWSALLTTYTTRSMLGGDGEPKLNLKEATTEDLTLRFGVDEPQAAALAAYFKSANATMEALLITDLAGLAQGGTQAGGRGASGLGASTGRSSGRSGGNNSAAGGSSAVNPLSTNQLRLIFRDGTVDDLTKPAPGKVNANTASREVLRDVLNLDDYVIDAIMNLRNGSSGGISSIVDLMGSTKITPEVLAGLARDLDVASQVFSITSRGRSVSTGLEVEITVIVDRSVLPARIIEYREQ